MMRSLALSLSLSFTHFEDQSITFTIKKEEDVAQGMVQSRLKSYVACYTIRLGEEEREMRSTLHYNPFIHMCTAQISKG